jgi:DNA polymerase II small subunit
MYGKRNALAPEKKDYLSMDLVPDIFVSGHVHGAGSMIYRGVRLINASTWQSQTDYQAKHNFNPDPGVMPIVNLGNGRVEMKSFMD